MGNRLHAGQSHFRSIECEFDHLFLVETPLAIGDVICGSHDGQRSFCVASNVSSIICFWSRRPLAIGHALAGSLYSQRGWSRGNANGDRLACAQKILEPTHVRLLRGIRVCVASNVSSIIYSWSRRTWQFVPRLPDPFTCSAIDRAGMRGGDRLACAQKILEPTHVRLLRGIGVRVASNVSSITCFWSRHLLAIGGVLAGSLYVQRD
jgi:hypothetical protein